MVILPSNVLEKQHNTSPEFKRDGCITLEFILTMQPNYCCRHWSQTNAFSAPSIIQCVFCSDWQPSPLEVCYSELLKPPAESEALCSHDNPEGHILSVCTSAPTHSESRNVKFHTDDGAMHAIQKMANANVNHEVELMRTFCLTAERIK